MGEIAMMAAFENTPVCRVPGQFYGLCAEPRQEQLAVGELSSLQGVIPYWPRIPRQEPHGRGSLRTAWRSMFPGYLLVKCILTDDNHALIRATRGVKRFLGCGAPQPISQGEVEVIRLYESEQAAAEKNRIMREQVRCQERLKGRSGIIWDFSPGEKVRIKYGPFASFYAELEAAVDEHDRVSLLVEMFGRKSRARLNAFDIEKLASG